ncbi:uncharacterized protein LOC135502276 [Lineus longissimus]|uniref:uncharacterized protein LOC135502276 n=1 Tax=Lineus longissimus TaxID=88925 RepID=UPI00315D8548
MKLSVFVLVCLQIVTTLTLSNSTTLYGFFAVAPPALAVKSSTQAGKTAVQSRSALYGWKKRRRKREIAALSKTTDALSRIDCAILCFRDHKCKTFSFSESLRNCKLMETKALTSTEGTKEYVKESVVTTGLSYCEKGQLKIGKFNLDGTDDFLCYNGEKKSFTVATTKVSAAGLWLKNETTNFNLECSTSESYFVTPTIVARDCSGDVLSDIICLKNTAPVSVSKARLDAESHLLSFEIFKTGFRQEWCPPTSRLYVEDFNGDKKADIVCHTYERTWKFFNMATDAPSDIMRSPTTVLRGCNPKEIPFFGDFNGDGKTDVLCRFTETNKLRLYHGLGGVTGTLSSYYADANDPCAGMNMYVGKFTSTPTDGLLCYKRETSSFKLMIGFLGHWIDLRSFQLDFCMADDAKMHVGYFYGTSKQDVMCHRPNGKIDILQII